MIQQAGIANRFIAFYAKDGAGVTGLTVTFSLWDPSGSLVVNAQAATEIGGGFYHYTPSAGIFSAPGLYPGKFVTAGDVDQAELPAAWVVGPTWVERLDAAVTSRSSHAAADVWAVGTRTLTSFGTLVSDVATAVWAAGTRTLTSLTALASQIAAAVLDAVASSYNSAGTIGQKINAAGGASDPLTNAVPGAYAVGSAGYALGRIGTGTVQAVQPVSSDGKLLQLVRGDDYFEADGRAIEFSSEAWPSLVGATSIRMTMRRASGPESDALTFMIDDKAASRVAAASGIQTVVFELAAAETALLTPGRLKHKYDVEATLASGKRVTLVIGQVDVVEDQTRP